MSLGRLVVSGSCKAQSSFVDTHLIERALLLPAILFQAAIHARLGVAWTTLELDAHVPGRLSGVFLGRAVCAGLQKLSDAQAITLDDGPVQRREARLIARMDVGSIGKEKGERDRIALVGSPHERGVALGVGVVKLLAGAECGVAENKDEGHDCATVYCEVEGIEPL